MEELTLIHGITSLGPTSILGFITYTLWKAYRSELEYNRAQDKANLESLNDMSKVLDKLAVRDSSVVSSIDSLKVLIDERTKVILEHLRGKTN